MTITRLATAACLGVSLIALAASPSIAATAAAPATTAAKPSTSTGLRTQHTPTVHHYASAATAANFVDPDSVRALGRMSAYLRTLSAFGVKLKSERDSVDDFGQVVTFAGETDYKVKTPNAFAIDLNEREKVRHFVYDGKTVFIYDPKSGLYARFAGRPTIRETLDAAAAQYNVTVPLDDLFHWDQGDAQTQGLTAGHYVSDATIDGQDAEQYAFRQAGIDWQIWITKGDKPLPVRVVIVDSDDPARPRFETNLTWDTAPQFAADDFVFTPPADAKLIQILSAAR